MYWIDARLDYIAFCDYNGSNRHTVLRDKKKILHPFSITLFEDMLFWSDWAGGGLKIKQGNKFHGGNHSLIHFDGYRPMDVHVVHPLQQPKGNYRVSQKFVPLLHKSVFQYDWTWHTNHFNKSCVFQYNSLFSYLLCHLLTRIFDLCTSALKVRVREYMFQPHFLYFITLIARTPSLFFVNTTKDKPP